MDFISWALWIASTALFVLFIGGVIVGYRRNGRVGCFPHPDEEVCAPFWPLLWAIALGGAGVIWNVIAQA